MNYHEKLFSIEEDFSRMLKTGTYEVTPGDINWLIGRIKKLTKGLEDVKNNLGVPQPGYPAPIAYAYECADKALLD